MRRQIQLSSRPVSRKLLLRIETLSKNIGLRNPPKVIISPSVNGPAVCGLWRPALMLSEWFEDELTEEEQNMILGHELMHIRRWDLPINALFYFIVILNWFNPLLWIAFYKIGIDREAACDEQLIGSSQWSSVEYGKVLLNMNSKQSFSGLALGFVGILNNSHSLRYRIRQIASQQQLNSSFKPFFLIVIVFFVVWGLVKPKLIAAEQTFNSESVIERISQMGKSSRKDQAFIKGLFHKYAKEIEPLKNSDQKIQLNQNLIAGKLSREEYNNFQKHRFGLGESRKGQGLAFFRTNENTYGKLYYTWGIGHKIHIQEVIVYDKNSQEKQLKSLSKLVLSSAGHADLDLALGSGIPGFRKAVNNGTYNPDIHCSSWDGVDDARAYLRSESGGVLLFPIWTPN
ncbi:beta-lactamase regulatory protein 1 [Lentisphaera araneosa HTCC2155]|uniref:Beta-lactamase regulatory protein 1 n=2 Tax=Lentisphaera TaxID=256846 RepID=A6DMV5_9BACT|nr:beta-lactamase regulatory protein 1 [Lentisphaera araneosa HTCC2155]